MLYTCVQVSCLDKNTLMYGVLWAWLVGSLGTGTCAALLRSTCWYFCLPWRRHFNTKSNRAELRQIPCCLSGSFSHFQQQPQTRMKYGGSMYIHTCLTYSVQTYKSALATLSSGCVICVTAVGFRDSPADRNHASSLIPHHGILKPKTHPPRPPSSSSSPSSSDAVSSLPDVSSSCPSAHHHHLLAA
jgi:hypothetical protein